MGKRNSLLPRLANVPVSCPRATGPGGEECQRAITFVTGYADDGAAGNGKRTVSAVAITG
jgi:hypothetical protein